MTHFFLNNTTSVSDSHWFQCRPGSSILGQIQIQGFNFQKLEKKIYSWKKYFFPFLFLWVIFALLDSDPDLHSQCGSGSSRPKRMRIRIQPTKINADLDRKNWKLLNKTFFLPGGANSSPWAETAAEDVRPDAGVSYAAPLPRAHRRAALEHLLTGRVCVSGPGQIRNFFKASWIRNNHFRAITVIRCNLLGRKLVKL